MKSPVLLIVFNRLDKVIKVFESIKQYEPQQLFIASDGWRDTVPDEKEKCLEIRNWIVSHVDWKCEVKTLYQSKNLGCGLGPATAISWFFNNVDAGIILEDDCIPHQDFFEYASVLLNRYAKNEDVLAINSSNFQNKKIGDGSYYFSMQNGPFCAWATWKRAWTLFDYTLNRYSKKCIKKSMKYYGTTKRERLWWLDIYDGVKNNRYNGSSWDYQFIFAIWAARGKTIVPNENLSSNIGFGPDATHTKDPNSVTANVPMKGIIPLIYPKKETISREADLYYHDYYYDKWVDHVSLYKHIKRSIKKLIKKIYA
ncbi:MAG: hemolysin hemolytic protein [Paludibacteraceae bacterium]|nr:hemolysin hemolytic protein [Paludibacteraceae bacterium]HOU68317.1 hemolysin hemolytic protein [Paludibacteraceae bacterium]HQJ89048.1 hemolysin hemolytic protein [Paludibacteraceae bacterium]